MKLRTAIADSSYGRVLVLENDGIGGDLLRGKGWEPHFGRVLSALSLEGATVLDIGANIGANTLALIAAVKERGAVIAFEPQRIPFQQLCGTVMLNGIANVIAIQKAVGEQEAIVRLEPVNYFAEHVNVGNTGLGEGGEMVEMITLDSLDVRAVSFIKMDIQGSETAALRGGAALIERERPVLFLEIEDVQLRQRGSSAEELVALLFDMKYDLLHINNEYPVDFVAIPREKREVIERVQRAVECSTQVFSAPE